MKGFKVKQPNVSTIALDTCKTKQRFFMAKVLLDSKKSLYINLMEWTHLTETYDTCDMLVLSIRRLID